MIFKELSKLLTNASNKYKNKIHFYVRFRIGLMSRRSEPNDGVNNQILVNSVKFESMVEYDKEHGHVCHFENQNLNNIQGNIKDKIHLHKGILFKKRYLRTTQTYKSGSTCNARNTKLQHSNQNRLTAKDISITK